MTSLQTISDAVTFVTGISIEQIRSKERKREVADARHTLQWFAREEGYTLEQIGNFTMRNYASIIHGVGKVGKLKGWSPFSKFIPEITEVMKTIQKFDSRREARASIISKLDDKSFDGYFLTRRYGDDTDEPLIFGSSVYEKFNITQLGAYGNDVIGALLIEISRNDLGSYSAQGVLKMIGQRSKDL
jgi:hypothetical protein